MTSRKWSIGSEYLSYAFCSESSGLIGRGDSIRGREFMRFESVVIFGGAGFVGSNLACSLRRSFPRLRVTALDSFKRRGSELNLPRLRDASIDFIHGDVRCPDDFGELPDFDLVIDCSAEPSVHAGSGGSPHHVLDTNLAGTINCLEAARERKAAFLFLSTSRVYPIGSMNALPFVEDDTRYRWIAPCGDIPGNSEHGIAEEYPLDGARSFYGASKLACELLIREYVEACGMPAIINRCGVLAGPLANGQGGPGSRDALGGEARVRSTPALHRLWGGRGSRYATYRTSTTSSI
jgi:CDP-paratose 2-epimerase